MKALAHILILMLITAVLPPAFAGVCTGVIQDPSPADAYTSLTPINVSGDINDGRIPLVVVHGIHERAGAYDDWDQPYANGVATGLIAPFLNNGSLASKFLLYKFSYDSDVFSVWEIGRSLRNRIEKSISSSQFPDKSFVIISHSMGGLVARAYMQDHKHNCGSYTNLDGGQRVLSLITLATPHHGSPVANKASRDAMLANADSRDYWHKFVWGTTAIQIPGTGLSVPNSWTGLADVAEFLFQFANFQWNQINRVDLLYDNFDGAMPNNSAENAANYLRALNGVDSGVLSPYNSKIIAYFGQLDPATYVSQLQNAVWFGPTSILGVDIGTNKDQTDRLAALRDLSILVNYGLVGTNNQNRPFELNDGVVPAVSGAFTGGRIQKSVACVNSNHDQMKDGTGPVCQNQKGVLQGVYGDLTSLSMPSYAGALDLADCSGITGWAWDVHHPDDTVVVEALIDGVSIGSRAASQYRPDLQANAGIFPVYHGLSIPIPTSYRDGNAHSVSLRILGTTIPIGTPTQMTCTVTPNYEGYMGADCNTVTGWAADRNSLNQPISVNIYDGTTLLTSTPILANGSRPDVGGFLHDNGNHGFNWTLPQSLKNGQQHSITVKYAGSSQVLGNSPVPITCSLNANYEGYMGADCNTVTGWAADRNNLNQPISINIYDGTTLLTSTPILANGSRPDVGGYLHDNGNHGFNWTIPQSLKNGQQHSITVKYAGSSQVLGNSPVPITCSLTANYEGYIGADCNSVYGWGADRNNLNQPISVNIYDGTTLLTSTAILANGSRPDVGAYLHDNGNHGFTWPIPQSLKNGQQHSITVKYAGSSQVLGNSPVPITCTSTPRYEGYVDYANCTAIAGWAADWNSLNQPINVEIWDGSTNLTSGGISANASRPDVGGYLHDNGNHGFTWAIPQILKNGASHTLTAKFAGAGVALGNTPKTISCSAPVVPQITSISPPPVPGSTQNITVSGSGFQSGMTVNVIFPDQSVTTVDPANVRSVTANSFLMVIYFVNAGSYSVRVTANGQTSNSYPFTVSQTVSASCNISPNPITLGQSTTVYGQGSGGTTPYSYSINSVNLGGTSSMNVTPSQTGTYTANITVTDSQSRQASNSCSVTVNPAPQPLTASCYMSPNPVILGQGTVVYISASGGVSPYHYWINSSDMGSSSAGTVTPTQTGTYTASITVRDSQNTQTSNSCSATVNPVQTADPFLTNFTYSPSPAKAAQVFNLNFWGGNFASGTTQVWFVGPGCTGSGCQTGAVSVASSAYMSAQAQLNNTGTYTVNIRNGTSGNWVRAGSVTVVP